MFSAPFEDDDFTAASGGGIINVGSTITDLIVFREQLIVFPKIAYHASWVTALQTLKCNPSRTT